MQVQRIAAQDLAFGMPWNLRASIVQRERDYLQRGGQSIFALSSMEVVTC